MVGNSKPVPAVFGIHSSTIAPLGTKTAPKRGVAGAADALNAGTIASRNGSAIAAPAPRRNVRRGSEILDRYIRLFPCHQLVGSLAHLKWRRRHDTEHQGR